MLWNRSTMKKKRARKNPIVLMGAVWSVWQEHGQYGYGKDILQD